MTRRSSPGSIARLPSTLLPKLAARTLQIYRRQSDNFKTIMLRRALHSFGDYLTLQYNSVYATFLGANATQLGSLHSAGNAIGALAALPAGWFIDKYDPKRVFVAGTSLLAVSALLYGVAAQWAWLYAAIVIYYVGIRITCTSCTVFCANELPNDDRATGRGLCQTASSIVAVGTPALAAWIIHLSGGLSQSGIRPLYFTKALVFFAILLLLLARLRSRRVKEVPGERRQALINIAQVFKQSPDVIRLVFAISMMEVPWTLSLPFMPVYAHQFKGADEFTLGGIQIASSILPLLLSIPLGRLADRHGRKAFLYAIAPLAYAGNLCLVYAPSEGPFAALLLISYGLLFGFNTMGMNLISSMVAEVMPRALMGRWIGVVSLFRGLLSIPAPLLGGLIWNHIGPQYVFIAAIAFDASVRLPLLLSIRETLHLDASGSAAPRNPDPPARGAD
jgi:MFS family permease